MLRLSVYVFGLAVFGVALVAAVSARPETALHQIVQAIYYAISAIGLVIVALAAIMDVLERGFAAITPKIEDERREPVA